ncbi:Mog1p/PsbP-like protein [Coprinopsis marcescibilis]|uniref:Mog1p/PsbP-like protein n=1 Tax=Coprinopsis marcescibilis TaxID=230819 RepID=A0A5C3L177_COPMA|nr:Mog1p/PsbP-like protein [Coprinopsis marcescibilis]
MSIPMIVRDFFGGAITASTRTDLIDAADIRQVPDTQEVLLYTNSSVSIIVEILERVEANDPVEAVRFHFDSVAHDNCAQSPIVEDVILPPNDRQNDRTPSAIVLKGEQKVTKFNRTTPDSVKILMALYRVEDKATDIVVTFNIPVASTDGGAVDPTAYQVVESEFDQFTRSFKIKDFSLFI